MAKNKFSVTKELLKTKSGFSVETTRINANNPKNLITLDEVKQLLEVMKKKGKDIKKFKIIGMNKMRLMTLKTEGEDFIQNRDYYGDNTGEEEQLTHFYQIAIIEKIPINKNNKK